MIELKPQLTFTEQILDWQRKDAQSMTGPIDVFLLNSLVYRQGKPFLIVEEGKEVGFCAIMASKELTALVVTKELERILHHLIAKKWVSSAFVSTRQPSLLSLCLDKNQRVEVMAYLFSDIDPEVKPQKKISFRCASLEDEGCIQKGVEYTRDFRTDVSNQALYLFEDQGKIYGTGTISWNPLQKKFADIGAAVHPTYRGKGIGSEIILRLKKICYDRDLIPSCGCDLGNSGSKRMLGKAGFVATDRMLKISFKNG